VLEGTDGFWFELEPDEHRYTANGSEVPATTRILELARNSLEDIPKRVVAVARDRSIVLHDAVRLHMSSDLDKRTLQKDVKLRFDQVLRFMDFHRVRPIQLPPANYGIPTFLGGIMCEVPLVHPIFRFGVTPDIGICEIEKEVGLVEVKGTSLHGPATALQTASQQATINHFFAKHGFEVKTRWSVRVWGDGYDVRQYKDKSDWPTFLSFMNVYNWRKVNKIGNAKRPEQRTPF
jgi:hypothetical protein